MIQTKTERRHDADPLNLRILCSECGALLEGAPPCYYCGSTEFEPYIPLRFVPEKLIEELRAKELEANMKGGNRKLTEEEKTKAIDLPAEAFVEVEPEPEAPATGEEIPPELLDQEGFS